MPGTWYPIRDAVRTVLSQSVVFDGQALTVVDQFSPDVWPQTRLVLEKAGAVFVPGTSRFEFDGQDAAAVVAGLRDAGRVQSATASHGWVPTPAGLAAEVAADYAEIGRVPGRRLEILEPSAGTGQLVDALLHGALFDEDRDDRCAAIARWAHVTAVEVEARRARHIPTNGAVDVVVDDFLRFAGRAAADGRRWDRIVMNPPFSVPGSPQAWAVHVLAAWRILAPGGRLAAIVPASVRSSSAKNAAAVASLANWHGGVDDLDDDAFAESGVTVPTAVVWLDRPLGAERPAQDGLPYVFRTYTGDEPATPVDRPLLARSAAVSSPVQVWRDSWRGGRERVLRHRAECATCARPLWGFDDGENDCRGVLGDSSAGFSLDPHEFGFDGAMPVGLCPMCANTGRTYDRGVRLAAETWSGLAAARAASPPTVVPAPRRAGPCEQLAMF